MPKLISARARWKLEAADEGVIESLLVPDGAVVPVGATIAILGDRTAIERHVRIEPSNLPRPVGARRVIRPLSGVEIGVVNGDILSREGDVLLLKHANGFHGVDAEVAKRCGFHGGLGRGGHQFMAGKDIGASAALFLGVGELHGFRYEGIKLFARHALELLASVNSTAAVLLSPVHGSGYGLDEKESFLSLISGFAEAIEAGDYPGALKKIEIVELDEGKAARLSRLLVDLMPEDGAPGARATVSDRRESSPPGRIDDRELSSFGAASEVKPKLFVAMPFADEFDDVWKIGIQEACGYADIPCERIDGKTFTGSIVEEIKKSLLSSKGVIGVLDGANANVFLEIGFAWALEKPTILIARSSEGLPFDVRGQRCILYGNSVHRLREELRKELIALKESGTFS